MVGTYHGFTGAKTALDPKEKYLIAPAVAAQIPCGYCVYANTQFAKRAGATEEQIHDAIAVAGFTRPFSAVIQGNQVDLQKFKGYNRQTSREEIGCSPDDVKALSRIGVRIYASKIEKPIAVESDF